MSKTERLNLINKLETKLDSHVVTYFMGDRPNFQMQIASDAIRVLKSHLDSIGHQRRINLFLYTRGGDLMTSFRLVKLFREYCDEFFVLIPYRAHSGGSLISIGANGVIMGKLGELTPVDPSTSNDFNPINPQNALQKLSISVEDVNSYLNLAKEKAGINEEHMIDVFRTLTDKINPVALGNVHRVYNVIRYLVPQILSLHMGTEDKDQIKKITEMLTQQLHTHDYLITRDEAEKIGLKIIKPDTDTETIMWDLYEVYEKDLELTEPFNPLTILNKQSSQSFSYETVYIESMKTSHAFTIDGEVINQQSNVQIGQQIIPQNIPITNFKSQKWKLI